MKKAFDLAGTHQNGTAMTTTERDLLISRLLTPYENMAPAVLEKKGPALIQRIITDFSVSEEQENQLIALIKKILSLPQVTAAQPAERIQLCAAFLEVIIRFPMSAPSASTETLMTLVPVFESFIAQVTAQPNEFQELEQALYQAFRKARIRQVVSEIIDPFRNSPLPELISNLNQFVSAINSYEESDLLLQEKSCFLSMLIEKIYGFPDVVLAAPDERVAFFSMLMRSMVSMSMVTTPDAQGQRLLSSRQAPQKELTEFLKNIAAGVNVLSADAIRELHQAIRINAIRQNVKNQLLPLQEKGIPQLLTTLPGLMQAINSAATSYQLPAEEGRAFIAAIIASLSSFQHVITGTPEDRMWLFSSLAGAIMQLNFSREPAALKQLLLPFRELIDRETALNAAFGQTLRQAIENKFDEIIIHSLTSCHAMTPAVLARNFPALIEHLHSAAKILMGEEKKRFLFVVMKTITTFPGIAASSSDERIQLFSALMEALMPILTVTDAGLQNPTAVADNQQAWLLFFEEMIEKIAPEQVTATQELRMEFEQALRQVRIRQSVIHVLTPYRNLALSDLKAQLPAFITSLNAYDAGLLSLEERKVLLMSIFKTLISLPDVDDYFLSDRAALFSVLMEEMPRLTLMTSPDTAGKYLVAVAANSQELTDFFNYLIERIAPEVGPVWKRALKEALRQTGIRKAIRQALPPLRGASSADQKQLISVLMHKLNTLSVTPDRQNSSTFFTLIAEEITLFIKEITTFSLPALNINAVDEADQFTAELMKQMGQLNIIASLQEQGQAMMRTLQDNVEKFIAPRRRYAVEQIILLQLHNAGTEDSAVLREISRLEQAYPDAITVRYDVINKVPEVIKGLSPLLPGEITLLVVTPVYPGTGAIHHNHNEQAGIGQQQLRMAFTALKNAKPHVLSRGSIVHPLLIEAQADRFRVIPTSIQS